MQPMQIEDPGGWDEFVSTLSLSRPEDEPLAFLTMMIHGVNQNLDKERDVAKIRDSGDLAEMLANALRTHADRIEEEDQDQGLVVDA